jgi:hypothetical protein
VRGAGSDRSGVTPVVIENVAGVCVPAWSLHALRRDLFFAHQGHVRRRHLDDQVDQALCLTLVINAAVLWTTTYLGDALRAEGYPVIDEDAAHLTPAQHDHINFYGTYSFDVETELRREEHRPLRSLAA